MKLNVETEKPKVLRMSVVRTERSSAAGLDALVDDEFYDVVVEFDCDNSTSDFKISDKDCNEIWIPVAYIPLLKKIFYKFDSELAAEIAEAQKGESK